MSRRETARRYILFLTSLFFTALGVAFTKHGGLGVAPISSVANVVSCRFTALSLGTWLIIWNCVLIAGQVAVLGRRFQKVQLLQVPLAFIFGWFTDLGMWLVSGIPASSYPMRLCMVAVGVSILGFGISLAVIANVIMNAGEALVKALADVSGKEFGNVKIAFDVSCVAASVAMSLAFFGGTVVGVREGTILSALFAGRVVKFFTRRLKQPLEAVLKDPA
ncbi:MAG: YitT family protein [Oscillospiraceae bacterium]|nr:YitT family protein [Oscillospiraceae bacterium]